MPNNTSTYWSANGESLHTFAKSIETLGPSLRVPNLRGEDIVVPNRPGDVYVPKMISSNVITLQMWVRGLTEGSKRDGKLTKMDFDTNWNNLVRLLWASGRRFNLTKRFYDRSEDTIIAATASAEFSGGFEPTMHGRLAGKFQVDLKIADGLFFAATTESIPLVNGDNTIFVPGNADTTKVVAVINGARSETKIWNKTAGISFTYPESLGAGDAVEISSYDMEATETPSGGSAIDTSHLVTHSGSPQWMILRPGNNVINLSSATGSGAVELQFRGAWT